MSIVINLCGVKTLVEKEINIVKELTDKKRGTKYKKIIESDEFKNISTEFNFLYNYFYKIQENRNIKELIEKITKDKKIKLLFVIVDNNEGYIKYLDYKKIKQVGEGAFGQVFFCEKNKKKYAIKLQIYDKKYWREPKESDFIKNRINEYKLAKKIGSHSIGPKVYETLFIYDDVNNKFINLIVMEYIKGEELMKYERKHKLKDNEVKKLQNKIYKLHKLNIYHKDLHKGNIMVVKKNKKIDFMIVDFGLARDKKNMIKELKEDNKKFHPRNWDSNNKKEKDTDLFITIFNLIKNKKIIVNC